MAEIGLSVLGKIAEFLIEPIQRELGYLFCFNNNFQQLQTRLDQLKAMKNDVQAREDAAKRIRQTIGEAAMKWIENANGEIEKAESLIKDKAEVQKGCFSIKWCPNISLRFSLSRKGRKLSLDLVELLQSGGQLPHTGYALPMPSINMRDYYGDARDFNSRSQIMEDIIEKLRDDKTMLIGICGMGGIGKTTFAKQVLQKVRDSHKHLFEIQVITTVSSSPNFNAIQQQIAEMLGSSLKGVEGEIARAQLLRNSFSNKKVVVLLDDVWEEFNLNAFGFPLKKPNVVGCCCKIIYTSRNKDLWLGERTITKKEIGVKLLTSEEAFNLFKREVGLQYDDIDFHWKNEIARQIVEECGRLPLALGVVGGALIEKEKHEWEDMLYQLKNQGQDQHMEKINKVLEKSYHFLKDIHAQSLFLLCCLFGEDQSIPVETLYRYAVGLQLFKGRNDLKRTRVHVYTIVDNLIRRNLLIKLEALYEGERAVKMHDLKNHLEVLDKMEFRGSKLELLRLDCSYLYRSNIKISGNDLFQGDDNFKVLDVLSFYHCKISKFPLFSPLTKLKMLSLEGMRLDMTTNISSIGYIKCLEILCLRKSSIKVLPNEISELTNLRLFDLTECKCFISNGVLLRLTNLQELYMWNSFQHWRLPKEDIKDGENHAAGLDELNGLHKLWRLELVVPNIEQVQRGVRLFSSLTLLEQFKIRIGSEIKSNEFESAERQLFESAERQLWLENIRNNTSFLHELEFLIGKGIIDLYLSADSGIWENMRKDKFLSLKYIELKQCGSLFPQSPPLLKTSEFGHSLRHIELYECNEMTHLCSTSISRNLTNLQTLVLQKCEKTEEVVRFCNDTKQLNKIEFNTLETLKLCDLPALECFCKRVNEIHFHKLKTLELKGLMKQFIFPAKLEIPCLEELSMESISNIETLCMLPSLQKLNIDKCNNFQYFDFSNSLVTKVISHLRNLTITNCKMLKGVVGITTAAKDQCRKLIEFPNLSTLELESLDELVSFVINVNNLGDEEEKSQSTLFYHDEYQVSYPCLNMLKISGLPKINYIVKRKGGGQIGGHQDDIQSSVLLLFPNLKRLELSHLEKLVSFAGVISNQDNNCKHQNVLFHLDDDEVSFPCLGWLQISGLPKINYIIGIKSGQVGGHQGDIEEEHGREIQQPILLFPNLDSLELIALEELVSFVEVMNNMDNNCKNENALFHPEDDEVLFPCLRWLRIEQLSKINYIIRWKEGGRQVVGHHHHDKIFPVLSYLDLSGLSNLIHMYEINQPVLGVHLFQNLKGLNIINCGKLRYLFSENIIRVAAKHLRSLLIKNCGMMEVVMKKEDELLIENDDKERGSNSDGNSHFFPIFERLYLLNLSGLRSFSDVAYTWALPSLEYLRVSRCPKLAALSPGYLDSPMLYQLKYGNDRQEVNVKNTWKGDINGALSHLFIKTHKEEEPVGRLEENMD